MSEFSDNDPFEEQVRAALHRIVESVDVETPQFEDIIKRSHVPQPDLVSRLDRFSTIVGRVVEATGFGHWYGGYESESSIGRDSVGQSTGKIYTWQDRIAKKIATVGAIGLSMYLATKHGIGS